MIGQHQLLFICPSSLTTAANALATATQHQPGDSNTFGRVWYSTSADGSTKDVSIANTRATDTFVSILQNPGALPSPPPHGADPTGCAQAVAALTAWKPGDAVPSLTSALVYAIDVDAQSALTSLGLVPWVDPNAPVI